MAPRPRTRLIGLIGFDGVAALDLVGPLEVFATAAAILEARSNRRATRAYESVLLGLSRGAFRSESNIAFTPHSSLSAAPPLDTLIVPGGCGLRQPGPLRAVSGWVRRHHRGIRRVASVCTGIYGLAEAGLLDGCTVATHWRFAGEVARRYPGLRVDADAIFIQQGRLYTSAGITAGIDLALALVEEDHGREIALAAARELVVHLKRSGGQKQYSEPLAFQVGARDRLHNLSPWIFDHLGEDHSVARLAERCSLSPRQLSRRFQRAFGLPPGNFVERLRIEEAQNLLTSSSSTVEQIAEKVGFRSADVFRRAFMRRCGIAPAVYRSRFSGTGGVDR
jgi:transcriptional regulator GlxA family with amidase domain